MAKQFADVSSRYGAPMGRRNYGRPPEDPRSVRLFRVNIDSGGYDDGGAYWGHGAPIYCAIADDYFATVRASGRFAAMALLEIDAQALKRPVALPGAYSVALEFCGQAEARYVLRYWGEFVSHHESRAAAVTAAADNYRKKARQ